MGKIVDIAALGARTRAFVERGVREAYGCSFAGFLDDVKIGGVDLTTDDYRGASGSQVNSPSAPGCPSLRCRLTHLRRPSRSTSPRRTRTRSGPRGIL